MSHLPRWLFEKRFLPNSLNGNLTFCTSLLMTYSHSVLNLEVRVKLMWKEVNKHLIWTVLLSFLFCFIYLFIIGYAHAMAPMWKAEGSLVELVLFFHCPMGSGRTISGSYSRHLGSQSHLTSPGAMVLIGIGFCLPGIIGSV